DNAGDFDKDHLGGRDGLRGNDRRLAVIVAHVHPPDACVFFEPRLRRSLIERLPGSNPATRGCLGRVLKRGADQFDSLFFVTAGFGPAIPLPTHDCAPSIEMAGTSPAMTSRGGLRRIAREPFLAFRICRSLSTCCRDRASTPYPPQFPKPHPLR